MNNSENKNKEEKKKISKLRIIMIFIFFVLVYFLGNKIDLSIIAKSHFNIITINTVIIGFLFTSLSILLGFLNKDLIDYLEDIEYMEKVFSKISFGMFLACINIALCMFNLIFLSSTPQFPCWKNYLYSLEVMLVIVVFANFILALFNVNIVVREIRKARKKERRDKKINERIANNEQ